MCVHHQPPVGDSIGSALMCAQVINLRLVTLEERI